MDGSFPSNPPPHGLGGAYDAGGSAPQRRGFRGNEQNAKTKICMRCGPGYTQFELPRQCVWTAQTLHLRHAGLHWWIISTQAPLYLFWASLICFLRRLCRRWKGGTCRFGSNCNFAHGEEELRRLPPRGEAYGGGGLARGQGRFVGGEFDAGFNSEQGFAQARPGVRLSPAGVETCV